jgi:lipopolysaccharide/colanic/teichoic acid biosynthesis glycosyltransferase
MDSFPSEGLVRTPQEVSEFEDFFETIESGTATEESSWWPEYLSLEVTPVDSWSYQYVKRLEDLFIASVLVIIFAIPCFIIALVILLTSKGGVFYREERIGRNGRPFMIWKFRSMRSRSAAQNSVNHSQSSTKILAMRSRKQPNDHRITAVGGFLRRWSLDELPQLLNVLRGEMSLVGPRPIVQSEVAFYGDWMSYYLKATPGLSGLWQVSGRSLIDYDRRARLDAFYVQTWSLRSDLGILFQTVPAVLGRIGAF